MKVIFLTDTHITTSGALWGLDPTARLQAAIADINQHHADAAAVVVLGDITDRGDPASYQLAKQLFDTLQMPYHLLAGNHDNRANLQAVFGMQQSAFIQTRVELPAATFLLLDTVDKDHATDAGEFCQTRGQWLQRELETPRADAQPHPVILCMHHHPLAVDLPEDRIRLLNPEHLVAAIVRAKQPISFIVCGHGHANFAANWCGAPLAMLRATVQQGYFTSANDAAFSYTHAQPFYGVMQVLPQGIVLHYHSYLDCERVGDYTSS